MGREADASAYFGLPVDLGRVALAVEILAAYCDTTEKAGAVVAAVMA